MTALAIYAVFPAQDKRSDLCTRMTREAAEEYARTASGADPDRSHFVMDFRKAVAEYRAGVLRACETHAPVSMARQMVDNLHHARRRAAADLEMFERAAWPDHARGEYLAGFADGRSCCLVAGYAKSLMHTAFRQLLAGES